MLTILQQEIKNTLTQLPEYWNNEVLLKNKIIEDIRSYKPSLLSVLLTNQTIKQTYSLEVDGITIFKAEDFINMLRYKNYLDNSYTKFSNEIGLTSEGKYLKYVSDIVLDFPHKDGILEGGMTQEDTEKEEVYYHNILAKEEIDTLLSPKILKNIKKYDEKGIHKANQISLEDNLIIKGNNLIALYSLKKRYSRKIKLIYIDPPYNTGNDSFKYNDRFNHSTWLTFMKNRLEIAKELLSSDGSIWINIDDDESHYLKVLADSIFGRENFIANIIWKKKYSPQNDAQFFSDMHDHILVYSRDITSFKINGLDRTESMNSRYTNRDNDPRGPWKSGDLSVRTYNAKDDYPITTPGGKIITPPRGRSWRTSEENFKQLVKENRVWFGEDGNNVPSIKRFLSDVKQTVTPQTIWDYSEVGHNQDARKEILALKLENADFSTPKPEKLIQRIIKIATNKDDIVLDFFMGSATTQAVAMKMERQFIGIEQMDYINEVSVPRLHKVINGEQGGISKQVGWNGKGSFIYAELFELNQTYILSILNAKNRQDIEDVLSSIANSNYLNIRADLDKLFNKQEAFFEFTLEEQKELLIQAVDNNQLYLSYSEIEDTQYNIDDYTKAFNHSFYQEGV